MCMVDEITPKWKGVASGIAIHESPTMISGPKNPKGTYLRRSDECLGTKTYSLVGCRISPNSDAESASLFVASRLLACRYLRTASTCSMIRGHRRIAAGSASLSHEDHRGIPRKYSLAVKFGRTKGRACGSDLSRSRFSSSERSKLPSSLGMLPNCASGTSEI